MTLDPLRHSPFNWREDYSHQGPKQQKKTADDTAKTIPSKDMKSKQPPSEISEKDIKTAEIDEKLKQRKSYIKVLVKTERMTRSEAENFVDSFY